MSSRHRIVLCIKICYALAKKQPPEGLRAHSTIAKAATTAWGCGVPVLDICRAATCASGLQRLVFCQFETRRLPGLSQFADSPLGRLLRWYISKVRNLRLEVSVR